MAQTLVHLVYIHGFQGNDTTFQSFPTDLQQHLSARIPPHLNFKIQSSLYPTYKSVKPISYATKNFLEWLSTQPAGPVILIGHSMGGLLAADAATDPSNNPDKYPGSKPHRIIGMIAFDTPYLGMHPHVVISGIASLLPKNDNEGGEKKTESQMNDHSDVTMVDEKVTDDWDAFKARSSRMSLPLSPSHSPMPSPPLSPPPRSPPASIDFTSPPLVDRTLSFLSTHSNDPIVRWARKHADSPFSAGKRWVVERFQFGACMFDPSGLKERYARLVAWEGGLWINYWTETVSRPKKEGNEEGGDAEGDTSEQMRDNDAALVETGITDLSLDSTISSSATTDTMTSTTTSTTTASEPSTPTLGARTKSEAKAFQKAEKAREKELRSAEKEREKQLKKLGKQREAAVKAASKAEKNKNKMKPGRHFIVLPTGLGKALGGSEKWEKVLIGGVEDEVAAHCGLFIPGQNLDYEGLVERVGGKVLGWCEKV